MLYEFRPHLGKARKRASVSAMDLSMVRYEILEHTAENNTFDAIDAIRPCLGDNETSTPECITADGQLHSPRSDQRRPISRLRPTAKLGSPMHYRRRPPLDVDCTPQSAADRTVGEIHGPLDKSALANEAGSITVREVAQAAPENQTRYTLDELFQQIKDKCQEVQLLHTNLGPLVFDFADRLKRIEEKQNPRCQKLRKRFMAAS
eukprot:FR738134.1.p1 GENE.FR738134.1~~FR738134.1.p1  ORF type:complete len:205 (+),score=0.20 FR738134.1:72-686(+)